MTLFDSINWTTHGKAMRKMKTNRVHYVKMVHNILPTMSQLNKYNQGRRSSCPLCECPQEDRDHIMRCPHPKRERWRVETLQRIQILYCQETQTYPQLTRLLVEALANWFAGNDVCSLNKVQFPSDLHMIIRKQAKVGWKQVLLGRFVLKWSRIQGFYMDRVNTQSGQDKESTILMTPEQWQNGLITTLWGQCKTKTYTAMTREQRTVWNEKPYRINWKSFTPIDIFWTQKLRVCCSTQPMITMNIHYWLQKIGCEHMPLYLLKAFAK